MRPTTALLSLKFFGLITTAGPSPNFSPYVMDLIAFLTAVLPVILYFALLEGGSEQTTWGKRWLGVQVTAVDYKPLTYR